MMRKLAVLAAIFVVFLIVTPGSMVISAEKPGYPINVETDRQVYPIGVDVLIVMVNVGNETLYGTPKMWIEDSDGNEVYKWCFLQVITPMEPGAGIGLFWDQTTWDNDVNGWVQVEPGKYYAHGKFAGYGDVDKFLILEHFPK